MIKIEEEIDFRFEDLTVPEEDSDCFFDENNEDKLTPIIPLIGMVAICGSDFSIDIVRASSVAALNYAIKNNTGIVMLPQIDTDVSVPKIKDLAPCGTYCKIINSSIHSNHLTLIARGECYICTTKVVEIDGAFMCNFETHTIDVESKKDKTAALMLIQESIRSLSNFDKTISPDTYLSLLNENNLNKLIDMTLNTIVKKFDTKYEVISTNDPFLQATTLVETIKIRECYAKFNFVIDKRVGEAISKNQKEYFLREQIKAIREELGDESNDVDVLTKKVKALKIPNKTTEKLVLTEINRLSKLNNSSPDYAVLRNYFDVICSLPWHKKSEDSKDLNEAKAILDKDHYGLELVKQRILEYLAVLNISSSQKMPILCLVGAPGVGKTSIAKSIARCLNRKFVKTSLGGVKDESEIRGHRRTYIGAMAGRIIKNMRISEVINPVFLLDEIDKMSSDYKGDPSSAMLEVLDSEQNFAFADNFLEVPYNLSNVLFVATANSTESIPKPLLDRMEVIEVTGYTIFEKLEIAKNFLLPKKQAEFNLKADTFTIDDECLLFLIENYTSESGVRELERQVSSLLSKAILHNSTKPENEQISVITQEILLQLMGKEKIIIDRFEKVDKVGFVNGLAWTSVGGAMLPIEVALTSGNGNVTQTGNLGDVLKESGMTAMTYIKSNYKKFGLNLDELKNLDLHIHLPMGATPKDGPSAGIAIATAIYSALKNKAISYNLAMTGEITLLGTVLAIGGVREKVLAAHRENVGKVILPKTNMRDLDEVPQNIKEKINFVFVSTFDDVIREAIG